MKDTGQGRQKNHLFAIGIVILLVLLALLAAGFFMYNKKQKTVKAIGKPTIAFVNEDAPAKFNDENYSLGKNFVDFVSNDKNYNWQVVSRSVADRAYADKSVDAVIYLPQTFTQDILTLQDIDPTKALVEYKVQHQSNELSDKTLRDKIGQVLYNFNQSVVKMYYASVADNIAQAESNMNTFVSAQEKLVMNLTNQVNAPFKQSLPGYSSFLSGANALKGINKANVSLQNSFTQETADLLKQTGETFNRQVPILTNYFDLQKKISGINAANGNKGILNQAAADQAFYHNQFSELHNSMQTGLSPFYAKNDAGDESGAFIDLKKKITDYNTLVANVSDTLKSQGEELNAKQDKLLSLEKEMYLQFFGTNVDVNGDNFAMFSNFQTEDNARSALAQKLQNSFGNQELLSKTGYAGRLNHLIGGISVTPSDYKLDELVLNGSLTDQTKEKYEKELDLIGRYANAYGLTPGTVELSDMPLSGEAVNQTFVETMEITVPAQTTYQSAAFKDGKVTILENPDPGGGGGTTPPKPGGDKPGTGGGTVQPGEDPTQPGGDTTKPGGGTVQPGGDTSKPGGGTVQPGGDTSKPGGGTIQPGGDTTKPGGGAIQPGGNLTKPGGGSAQPGGNIPKPGGGTVQLGRDIPNPGRGITQPGGNPSKPGGGAVQPGRGDTPHPGSGGTSKPGGGDTPHPGGGDTPHPGGGDTPHPGGGDTPHPGGGDTPHPGGGDTSHPGGGSTPQPGGGGDTPQPGTGDEAVVNPDLTVTLKNTGSAPETFIIKLEVDLKDKTAKDLEMTWTNQDDQEVLKTTSTFGLLPDKPLDSYLGAGKFDYLTNLFSQIDVTSDLITTLFADPDGDDTSLQAAAARKDFENASERSIFHLYGNMDLSTLIDRLGKDDISAFRQTGQANIQETVKTIQGLQAAEAKGESVRQTLNSQLPDDYFETNVKSLQDWYKQISADIAATYQTWKENDITQLAVKDWSAYDSQAPELYLGDSSQIYQQINTLIENTTKTAQSTAQTAKVVKDNSPEFDQLVTNAEKTQDEAQKILDSTNKLTSTGSVDVTLSKGYYASFSTVLSNTRTKGVDTNKLYDFFAQPIAGQNVTPKEKILTAKSFDYRWILVLSMGVVLGIFAALIISRIRERDRH